MRNKVPISPENITVNRTARAKSLEVIIFFTKYYYEDYINLPLILSVANELMYCMYIYVFRFLIRGRLDLPYYFRNIMLPEIIFTSVTTLLIYRLFLSASRRVDDIGKRRDIPIV